MIRAGSDCQTMTALGTTGAQNGTATAGFLANQETMSSFTTANGGLVSTLHDRVRVGRKREFGKSPLLECVPGQFVNLETFIDGQVRISFPVDAPSRYRPCLSGGPPRRPRWPARSEGLTDAAQESEQTCPGLPPIPASGPDRVPEPPGGPGPSIRPLSDPATTSWSPAPDKPTPQPFRRLGAT